jgi:hypothetical protein
MLRCFAGAGVGLLKILASRVEQATGRVLIELLFFMFKFVIDVRLK